jgi:hypothetical protein
MSEAPFPAANIRQATMPGKTYCPDEGAIF